MFRVVAAHPDADNPAHAPHQVAGPFDYEDEARAIAEAKPVKLIPGHVAADIEEPIRPDGTLAAAEAAALGCELTVERLVPDGDDAHRWEEV